MERQIDAHDPFALQLAHSIQGLRGLYGCMKASAYGLPLRPKDVIACAVDGTAARFYKAAFFVRLEFGPGDPREGCYAVGNAITKIGDWGSRAMRGKASNEAQLYNLSSTLSSCAWCPAGDDMVVLLPRALPGYRR